MEWVKNNIVAIALAAFSAASTLGTVAYMMGQNERIIQQNADDIKKLQRDKLDKDLFAAELNNLKDSSKAVRDDVQRMHSTITDLLVFLRTGRK